MGVTGNPSLPLVNSPMDCEGTPIPQEMPQAKEPCLWCKPPHSRKIRIPSHLDCCLLPFSPELTMGQILASVSCGPPTLKENQRRYNELARAVWSALRQIGIQEEHNPHYRPTWAWDILDHHTTQLVLFLDFCKAETF
eukprot:TRINITY_DN1185_c0_g1_i2.p1 TRINITY_DN1185_c0_g1~~TRINITY_DN1185_c0_g1_i2.p1  ORF type:complete len:138 (+),score=5.58 TRINITY_DN1185_c0_g1_i2:230-643(+)